MEYINKTILSLCSGTGAWEKPYVEAGYNVISITLPDNDVRTYIPPDNVYGILAAPVCTHFSFARTRAKTPRDFRQGMELVIACLNIIWECRYDHKLAFWCLENPTGFLRQFLVNHPIRFFIGNTGIISESRQTCGAIMNYQSQLTQNHQGY